MITKQFYIVALGLFLLTTMAIAEEKAAEPTTKEQSKETAANTPVTGHCAVNRLQMAKKVENREPQNVTETFSPNDAPIFAFAELSCANEGHVTFHWKHEGKEHAKVQLPVKSSPKWRTYSSDSHLIPGNWSVAIVDDAGTTLKETTFTVTDKETTSVETIQPKDSTQTIDPKVEK